MKVSKAIEMLSGHDPDDEIVIAYWTKQWFIDILEQDIGDEEWSDIVEACNNTLELNGVGDDMQATAIETIGNNKGEQQ
jgi:hypothetical protein